MTNKINHHLKLSPHEHTARRTAHHNTSYPILILILLLGLLLVRLISMQRHGVLATVTQSGNINVSAVVVGPPPTIGATIIEPADDTHTNTQLTTVSGTCSPGLLVKIYKNAILAGSTTCTPGGEFSLQISLLPGRNDLTALNYDSLNQAGPVTPTVVVYLEVPDTEDVDNDGNVTEIINPETTQPITSHTTLLPPNAFYVSTDYELRGLKKDQSFTWKLSVVGGTAPYQVSVDWGDGSTDNETLASTGTMDLEHTYKQSGNHTITIIGTDAKDRKTYLQLIAIVDGPPETAVVPATTLSREGPDYWMITSIILYGVLFTMLLWLWLREHNNRNKVHPA